MRYNPVKLGLLMLQIKKSTVLAGLHVVVSDKCLPLLTVGGGTFGRSAERRFNCISISKATVTFVPLISVSIQVVNNLIDENAHQTKLF